MKKYILIFALAVMACTPKPALKTASMSSSISKMEAAPVTLSQTFQVQPGDSFKVDFFINTTAIVHSVQFNVTAPPCLALKANRFIPGEIFAGQVPEFVHNYFPTRLYIAASVDLGKPGDTGNKLIASHVFVATGAGSGTIALTDVLALKYDDSQIGHTLLQTTAENMDIVLQIPVIESATVIVKIQKL